MKVVVTGGAGFIGANAAARYLKRGHRVIVLDNLDRAGATSNLAWLRTRGAPEVRQIDVRDGAAVANFFAAYRDADLVLHLAGQVAVTTSVAEPRVDFEANALGTLNVLEAVRHANIGAPFIYASTNKVYGAMESIPIAEHEHRYAYAEQPHGVDEGQPLDFHSPYGCSKGAADQYVRDYHRIYGLNTVVFRQSCIYGPRQFGIEDQGWIAWFIIASELGLPLTIYGDGKQVRDVLWIDDLLDAFDAAAENIDVAAGRVYNIGGGPDNAISLLDLIELLGELRGEPLECARAPWRPGDQRVYVSDIRRAARELNWRPRVGARRGIELLRGWVCANLEEFREVVANPGEAHARRKARQAQR